MSLASLLILMGLGPWDPTALILGVALALVVFGLATWLATRRWGDRPAPAGFKAIMLALAAFYLVSAVAAAVADPAYALAAMVAALIPFSAVLVLLATTRSKTTTAGGRPVDRAGAAQEDPHPGIGMDDETPLGDTPEHSDAERVARPDRRFERRARG